MRQPCKPYCLRPEPYTVPRSGGSGRLVRVDGLQEYLAHKKQPPLLGPPEGPRHGTNVGSWVGAFAYERGTSAGKIHTFRVQGTEFSVLSVC